LRFSRAKPSKPSWPPPFQTGQEGSATPGCHFYLAAMWLVTFLPANRAGGTALKPRYHHPFAPLHRRLGGADADHGPVGGGGGVDGEDGGGGGGGGGGQGLALAADGREPGVGQVRVRAAVAAALNERQVLFLLKAVDAFGREALDRLGQEVGEIGHRDPFRLL